MNLGQYIAQQLLEAGNKTTIAPGLLVICLLFTLAHINPRDLETVGKMSDHK